MLREVGADDVLDVRVLHLHRDLGAVVQRRGVHLRERRGRERRLVEAGEELASSGRPSSRSTCALISAKACAGTASWHCLSRSMNDGGKRSERVAIAWHILMITPRRSNARSSSDLGRALVRRRPSSASVRSGLPRALARRGSAACTWRTGGPRSWPRGSVRYRRVRLHRLAPRRAHAAASKPVRAGGVQLGASASNSSSSERLGLGRPRPRCASAPRVSSRCSRGRVSIMRESTWCSRPSTTTAPDDGAAVLGAQRARARLGQRGAQVLDVRALVAADVADHRAGALRLRRDLGIGRAASRPSRRCAWRRPRSRSTCAIMLSMR